MELFDLVALNVPKMRGARQAPDLAMCGWLWRQIMAPSDQAMPSKNASPNPTMNTPSAVATNAWRRPGQAHAARSP